MLKDHDFDVIKILRAHSKNNDNADVQTQVWSCAFEPDDAKCFYPGALTVATCGGNSVCFIDGVTGRVLAKYYAKKQILFFSLAWSSLQDGNIQHSILAAGGSQSSLFIIDSQTKRCVVEHEFKGKPRVAMNTVCFHPTEKQLLFCGTSDGLVRVVDIKKEASQTTSSRFSIFVLHIFSTNTEVYDLAFCLTTKYLLSSSENGLNCFSFPSKDSLRQYSKSGASWVTLNVRTRSQELQMAGNVLVDSVQVLKDGLIACKYALHGCIYICDLKEFRNAHSTSNNQTSYEIEPLYTLNWSDTDNYFMYMGVSIGCEMLSCGDDRGNIWLYDLRQVFSRTSPASSLDPSMIVQWPNLLDHYNDKKRKLRLDTYDIVVDRVTIHTSGHYIVAVTNNNLVCLWKRIDDT